MSFSFSSLVRLTAFLAIGSTMFAVGVSRVDHPSAARRTRHHSTKVSINDYYVKAQGRDPRWFDVESGRVDTLPLVSGDVLEAASCSPWLDEANRGQVAGRWSMRHEAGPMSTSVDFGLARYSFPGGELLDHVSTDIVPVSPPAWYPGTRARILFASGDGRLYHHAFERDPRAPRGPAPDDGDSRPRPVAWRCPSPGLGPAYLSEVQWSDDPRMGGRVVVTLRRQILDEKGSRAFARTQLWWLKLDQSGTAIVEAGRLIGDDPDDDHDERNVTIATLPDGRLVASYLRQQVGVPNWQLRVAPIQVHPDRRTPEILAATSRVVSDHCQPSPSAFSSDGRFLAAVVGQTAEQGRPTRLSTASILFPEHRPLLVAGPDAP